LKTSARNCRRVSLMRSHAPAPGRRWHDFRARDVPPALPNCPACAPRSAAECAVAEPLVDGVGPPSDRQSGSDGWPGSLRSADCWPAAQRCGVGHRERRPELKVAMPLTCQ
jgi:hypothetical protein